MIPTSFLDTFARDNLPPPALMPDLIFNLPELRYPDRLNCVVELLDKTVAAGHGERIAFRWLGGNWTYNELLDRVDRIAHVLMNRLKLLPGNRVLLRGVNDPMMAACWLAAVKAGLIVIATIPVLRAKELRQILDRAQIGTALCDVSLREELELAQAESPILRQIVDFNAQTPESIEARLAKEGAGRFIPCDTAADDVCLIAFTSGTSGSPKATMHFHRDVMAICDCFPRSILQVDRDDVFCGTAPLGFTFGLGGLLLFPMRFAASTVLLGRLTPDSLLRAIQEYRATICFTVPTFYRKMAPLAAQYDLRSLKKTVSAGEALPVATIDLWQRATSLRLIDGIGATELLHIFISASELEIRKGAIGRPIPGYEACILDEEGHPLPVGQVGRLAVKGPTGCRYLADDRQSSYVRNGWNITGDACFIDPDGYFWYQGRTDDMIITSGYNVASAEVEGALLQHPAVLECGVIGSPDEMRGEIVKAFVVLNDGYFPSQALARSLQEHVKITVAPYKYPRAIEFCASLPRTETGKLQRFRLRESSKRRSAKQEDQSQST